MQQPITLIGKRVTLTIGGNPEETSSPNEIIGEHTRVHVDSSQINNHSKIVGEQTVLCIGSNQNSFQEHQPRTFEDKISTTDRLLDLISKIKRLFF